MPHCAIVRNPQALLLPQIEGLITRAIEATPRAAPYGLAAAAEDVLQYVTLPHRGMLLGYEDDDPVNPKAVVFWVFPTGGLFPYPNVTLIYNEGSKALKRAMAKTTLDTIFQAGFPAIWIINGTGHGANVWHRALMPANTKSVILGDFIEVTSQDQGEDTNVVANRR